MGIAPKGQLTSPNSAHHICGMGSEKAWSIDGFDPWAIRFAEMASSRNTHWLNSKSAYETTAKNPSDDWH